METRGANGNVGSGHATGGAFDPSESPRHPPRAKRQLAANTEQFRERKQKRRTSFHHDDPFVPTEPHLKNPPAPSKAAATNGVGEGIQSDLYDLPEGEIDNADFELNLLAAGNSAETTKALELQVPNEDLWQFFSLPPVPDSKEPPPSVLREFDNISISTATSRNFDPTLQFSPPNSVSPTTDEVIDNGKGPSEEVSWDFVNSPSQPVYTADAKKVAKIHFDTSSVSHVHEVPPATPPSTAISPPAGMLLRPYKAWFHLREMLQAKQSMYKNQPEVVFEFFGRVVQTRRENFERKQLFQLRDLFKISPPYISGVLLN